MPEEDRARRERDMVLAPNEYMYVQDETKGHVDVFLGPTKQSLSGSDHPVVFDEQTKRFQKRNFDSALQIHKTAPEGWYIVLKNPARDGKYPNGQGKMSSADLDIGRKVNIPGPTFFALWPGQMVRVLKGHHLRSNQYLLVRVYDEQAAQDNWQKSVVKSADVTDTGNEKKPAIKSVLGDASALVIGKLYVIRGTDVSFYIPPSGVEVVPDAEDELERSAVTLERLEYCLLMDENGNKRYEIGPAVVFPKPTEIFVERALKNGQKTRKFRAIELNENSGVYVKVIADYEEGGKHFKVGDEIFITGKDQMIYFPREEHAIIKYDSSEIHYGIAIPAGEARYVLDRNRGNISLSRGPIVFLPDPRRQVIVRRVLDFKTCSLLFPNNLAAQVHNAALSGQTFDEYRGQTELPMAVAASGLERSKVMRSAGAGAASTRYTSDTVALNYSADFRVGDSADSRGLGDEASDDFSGDSFIRKTSYSGPRTIILPTKFDGAVSVDIWNGYAMLLVSKSGERRVVLGPQTVLLEYDESPQVMELSRGRPKNTDDLLRTIFLRTQSNKISDLIEVETKDFCRFELKLSYRVLFEGDPNKWFDVENYVKFLCDHMRSKIRGSVRKLDIEAFYSDNTSIIRDIVLGKVGVDGESRAGAIFKENGMRIYDVEVLKVSLQNPEIEKMLNQAQKETISATLSLQSERRKLECLTESEDIVRKTEQIQAQTREMKETVQHTDAKRRISILSEQADLKSELRELENTAEMTQAQHKAAISVVTEKSEYSRRELQIMLDKLAKDIELHMLEAQVEAVVKKAGAITPDLIAALTAFGEKLALEKAVSAMAPLAIFGGESIADVISRLLEGTSLSKALATPVKNGHTALTQTSVSNS